MLPRSQIRRRRVLETAITIGTALAVAGTWRICEFRKAPLTIGSALVDFDRRLRERGDAREQAGTDSDRIATKPERRLYDLRDLLRPAVQFDRDIRGLPYSAQGRLPMPGGGSMSGSGISDPYTDWGRAADELQIATEAFRWMNPSDQRSFSLDQHGSGVLIVEADPAGHERFAELLELLRAIVHSGANP